MVRIIGLQPNQKLKHALIFCVATTLVIYQWSASIRFYSCPLNVYPNNTCNLYVTIPQAYNKWIQTELGESMRVAKLATGSKPSTFQTMTHVFNPNRSFLPGGMARLEGSGLLFLRSLCRLTHVGHAQYYKGDGHAFQDFLEEHYPGTFFP
jgi:hypothetical protein